MSAFIRNLVFVSDNLGKDATLLLSFLPLEGLQMEQLQICWKVSEFRAEGPYELPLTYMAQIAFIKPVLEGPDNFVFASTWQPLNLGQTTTLEESQGAFSFTEPKAIEPATQLMQGVNGTPVRQDMAIGFIPPDADTPVPALYFPDVGSGDNVTAKFTPVLRAYISNEYQQSQLITGDIQGPAIWTQDLTALDETTQWQLTYDPNTGDFSLTQVPM